MPQTQSFAVESKEQTPAVVGAAPAALGGLKPAVALIALRLRRPEAPPVIVWLPSKVQSAMPASAVELFHWIWPEDPPAEADPVMAWQEKVWVEVE